MNIQEKQSKIEEIELKIRAIGRKIRKINNLPEAKRKSTSFNRLFKISVYNIIIQNLIKEAYIIQSQPIHNFKSGCVALKK